MANIGATTAFYKVETSLTRANNEVSKSMERLATGKANASAGDRSSFTAMGDTFRLDYVGTKAGLKGAAVVMGYLETGMRVLDAASGLLSKLQELAVLAGNDTNTTADNNAINNEGEAIADEFDRLLTDATYKGKSIFTTAAGDMEVSIGGRSAAMSFGIIEPVDIANYSALYDTGSSGGAGALKDTLSDWHASASGTATAYIEALQGDLNTRRVQAGSQYAALESAVSYTTDLTAQYELGFNAVSDVNFSMETAHLAKNQILQQAATAMLAQANSGQQGLLQLIQG
jgi:flagellin